MKAKYILITLGIIILILAIVYAMKEANAQGATSTVASTFPLHKGSHGTEVKNLQAYLNWAGSYGISVDGVFGDSTEKAVLNELTGLPTITNPAQVPDWYYNQYIKTDFVNGIHVNPDPQAVH